MKGQGLKYFFFHVFSENNLIDKLNLVERNVFNAGKLI